MTNQRRQEKLSAAFVRTVTKPGKYGDGRGSKGLVLDVNRLKNGRLSKTYQQKLKIEGRGRNGGDLETMRRIGPADTISLKKARKVAKKWAKLAARGIDPKEHTNKIPTFEVVAKDVLKRDAGTRSEVWSGEIENWLTKWVYPLIGAKRVDNIKIGELYQILTPLCERVPSTASRVTAQLRTVFDRCVTRGYIQVNPITKGFIDDLPQTMLEERHHPALPHSMLADAISLIDQATSTDISTRNCLKVTVLTGMRIGAVRLGEWTEFRWKEIKTEADWSKGGWEPVDWDDLKSGRTKRIVWVIPKDRMKGRKGKRNSHRVPVSGGLLDILLQMRAVIAQDGRDPRFVFPSRSFSAPVHSSTVREFCNRLSLPSDTEGRCAVIHGFRSAIRDWCAEHKVPFEVAETVLAHELPQVVRAYLRSDVLSERYRLMQAWSDYATGTLPNNWKWTELDNETVALIAELRQSRIDADKRAAKAEKRAAEAEQRAERIEAQLADMNETLKTLAAT